MTTATRRPSTVAAPTNDWRRRPEVLHEGWETRSACYNRPESWWDGDAPDTTERARAVCLSCPVLAECLDAQMRMEKNLLWSRSLVRGGLTGPERIQLCLDERIDGEYDAEEARLLALEAGAYGQRVVRIAGPEVSVSTRRLAARLAGETVSDRSPKDSPVEPEEELEGDDALIDDYLKGGPVRLTPDQQVAAVCEGIRRRMTYLDIDKVQKQAPNTTAQFVSRMRKKYLDEGRPFPVQAPTRALLTEEQVIAIRERYARGGVTHMELGMRYQVSRKLIGSVISGVTYKAVGGPISKGRSKTSEEASKGMNRSLNDLAFPSGRKSGMGVAA